MFQAELIITPRWPRDHMPIGRVQVGERSPISKTFTVVVHVQRDFEGESTVGVLTEHDDGEAEGDEGDGELVHLCDWAFGGEKAVESDVSS